MKRTAEDETYAQRFADELGKVYSASKSKGLTDEVFAASIGVKRAALRKYLCGMAVPSLHTVVLAKRNHGIDVRYGAMDLSSFSQKGSTKQRSGSPGIQLRLPFSIEVSHPKDFQVQLKKVKAHKYELYIRSKRLG